jgi:beta-1,3-galactosyltransferase / beta-1,3-N-acetylglucosaminyltransferase
MLFKKQRLGSSMNLKLFSNPYTFFNVRTIVRLCIVVFVLYLFYIFGVLTHLWEKELIEFYSDPSKIHLKKSIDSVKLDTSIKNSVNNWNYAFKHTADNACREHPTKPYLTILVKSKWSHFEHRHAIRQTWGQKDNSSLIRTVFLIGLPSPEEIKHKIEISIQQIEDEHDQYKDIVQQNFYDTYYNNTLKTFMGISWIVENCKNSKFYLFIDDDFYLNPNLLMKYLQNNVTDSMLDKFYAGYVFANSAPMRHLLSKWYISLEDFPYSKWPPYAAAGA